MPAYQTVNFCFLETVHNYFAQLNPIASKISEDINETRLAYGNLWHRLKPNEHADIINETIIKPEISLLYFDKFSSSSSISRASLASSKDESTDSSVAAVNKKDYSSQNDFIQNKNNTARIKSVKAKDIEPTIKSYGFDRNRLRTYASQKVALKIIRDEILGIYRDEHSKPFSYKTKSQINLHLFTDSSLPNDDDDHICLLSSTTVLVDDSLLKSKDLLKTDLQPSITNYKELEIDLSSHINKTEEKEIFTKSLCSIPYEKVNNFTWNVTNNKSSADNNSNMMQTSFFNNSNAIIKEQRLKSYMETSSATPSTAITYAVYSDDFFDRKESNKLMQNCSSSGVLTTSSSSAATSDDDEDDDEKTLCEEVKLLDNDISLRRGFDFLNNW